jgi:hypothetical protein
MVENPEFLMVRDSMGLIQHKNLESWCGSDVEKNPWLQHSTLQPLTNAPH